MKKHQVAVLDFGSSKLCAMVGEKGVNETFVIKASLEEAYEGFYEGEFLDVDELKTVVPRILDRLSEEANCNIDRLYVGVPGEFVSVLLREKVLSFPKKKKVTRQEIEELFDIALKFNNDKYRVIDRSAVYYVLDDNRRIVNPMGLVSDKLGGLLSYSLADVYFENTIRPILAEAEIRDVTFVSSILAESMYLFAPEQRDRYAMLLDVGHLTTTLALVRGDGILYQKSMPFGGGHISADLSDYLKTDYHVADALKRKINISRKASLADYQIVYDDVLYEFGVDQCNDIVKNNLDSLCDMLDECLKKCDVKYPEYLPIHITGGGILLMRGCKEYVANSMDVPVEAIAPELPIENKPTDSSKFGLLNYAIERERANQGLFHKLFNK